MARRAAGRRHGLAFNGPRSFFRTARRICRIPGIFCVHGIFCIPGIFFVHGIYPFFSVAGPTAADRRSMSSDCALLNRSRMSFLLSR